MLNAAFLEDGVHVVIPEGAVLTAPIHVLLPTLPEAAPVMAHPRIADRGRRAEPGHR